MGHALVDAIDIEGTFSKRVPTLCDLGVFKPIFGAVLQAVLRDILKASAAGDDESLLRAWKTWFLLPRMLLAHPKAAADGGGSQQVVLRNRFDQFRVGDWAPLFRNCVPVPEMKYNVPPK